MFIIILLFIQEGFLLLKTLKCIVTGNLKLVKYIEVKIETPRLRHHIWLLTFWYDLEIWCTCTSSINTCDNCVQILGFYLKKNPKSYTFLYDIRLNWTKIKGRLFKCRYRFYQNTLYLDFFMLPVNDGYDLHFVLKILFI